MMNKVKTKIYLSKTINQCNSDNIEKVVTDLYKRFNAYRDMITDMYIRGDYERAKGIIDDAIKDLNVDYIDLLLIHQPGADDEGVYKAMEEAVADGRLRSIGISNYYTKEQVDEVLSFANITPAVIQNENHIYYQNKDLQEYVKVYGKAYAEIDDIRSCCCEYS